MAANAGLAIVMILEGGYAWERLRSRRSTASRIDAYLPGRTELRLGESRDRPSTSTSATPPMRSRRRSSAVRRVTPGKVVMLFGADGDRDATKRHDMGRTAVEGSDILVITDHHPRHRGPRPRSARP